MRLEDKSDVFPDANQRVVGRAVQLLPEHPDASLLNRSQRACERQDGRLAGTGRPFNNNDFPRQYVATDVKKDLLPQRA